VAENGKAIGTISVAALGRFTPDRWDAMRVGDAASRNVPAIAAAADVAEALRMLARQDSQRILLVMSAAGEIEGIVTGGDILRSLQARSAPSNHHGGEISDCE